MSLDSLLSDATNEDLKFVFVGGKGGVGKTTSSSAIATLLATKCNKRVLLVSTDPAHSLSDAFRCDFSNTPTSPGIDNLDVLEVDPSETMKDEIAKWTSLAEDVAGVSSEGEGGNGASATDDLSEKVRSFQEWLSGIPGIDEATALVHAIQYIESAKYDLVVFDTAPTGHTLKLLQMPDILQTGIEKLQSWQTTLWSYWEVFKGLGSHASKKRATAKEMLAQKLENYKHEIQKVALMLQDQQRTRFIVVCIAEYLSVSETQRLLQELQRSRVRASHVVVNQLVIKDSLSHDQLNNLEKLAELGSLNLDQSLLAKTVHACRLTTARKAIQEKYLKQLKMFPETQGILEGICEVPLLPEEVTGKDALCRFGNLMIRDHSKMIGGEVQNTLHAGTTAPLYEEELKALAKERNGVSLSGMIDTWIPAKGDTVVIKDLVRTSQYNGLKGVLITDLNKETNRYGVSIQTKIGTDENRKVALQRKNFDLIKKDDNSGNLKRDNSASVKKDLAASCSSSIAVEETVDKAKQVLEDPEIKAMIAENPQFKDAVQDVLANPMNFMKYLMDPAMSPLISKAMSKLRN